MAALTVVTNGPDQHQMNMSSISSSAAATCFVLTTAQTVSPTAPMPADGTVKTMSSGRTVSKIAPKRRAESGQSSAAGENAGSSELLRCKRRIQFGHSSGVSTATAHPGVARRNERERNRVRQVNLGFATLRQHVPNGAKSKKMSKVETLRSAVQYIKQLQQLLVADSNGNDDENSIPTFPDSSHHQHHQQYPGQFENYQLNYSITSPHCSAASSPTPSLGSDASSPYDSLSPEDEDLLDFTTWLS